MEVILEVKRDRWGEGVEADIENVAGLEQVNLGKVPGTSTQPIG